MKQLVFGITGPTGAGKSTVSNFFRSLGVTVVDADALYHSLIKADMPCTKELARVFGEWILSYNGDIDRKKLGAIVFSDKEKLKRLNSITHKYIKQKIVELIDGLELCAIDGAVIIGSDIGELCEYIVCVSADEDVRYDRIMHRDNISFLDAKRRISSQESEEFFINNADFVIENNDGCDIEKQARDILSQMQKRSIDG